MKKFVLACMLGSSLAGCATVMNGTNQPVEFQSEPGGALIRLAHGQSCETPCRYQMKRGHDSMVTFTLAGHKPVDVYIQSRTGGGVVGNVIGGGLIGGVVDASNGAANHLYPDPVYIRMVPVGGSGSAMLLNKKGEVVSSVDEYNAKVSADVIEGMQKQGLTPTNAAPR